MPSRLRNQAEFIHWGNRGALSAERDIPTQPGVFRYTVRPADRFQLTGKPTERMRWLGRQVRRRSASSIRLRGPPLAAARRG